MINPRDTTDDYRRINELKNYLYCPRISYYALCLGLDRETGLSKLGIEAEQAIKGRMKRRQHALHAVVEGERLMNVLVTSHKLRLIGKIDEVVKTADGLYLIDYKDTTQDYGYWHIQMCAYQLCVNEMFDLPVLGCYIYSIPNQQYMELEFTAHTVKKLYQILEALNTMVELEQFPSPTKQMGKCRICQYSRFCNDVF
jgi:CRISPR-associated protein Cas4